MPKSIEDYAQMATRNARSTSASLRHLTDCLQATRCCRSQVPDGHVGLGKHCPEEHQQRFLNTHTCVHSQWQVKENSFCPKTLTYCSVCPILSIRQWMFTARSHRTNGIELSGNLGSNQGTSDSACPLHSQR